MSKTREHEVQDCKNGRNSYGFIAAPTSGILEVKTNWASIFSSSVKWVEVFMGIPAAVHSCLWFPLGSLLWNRGCFILQESLRVLVFIHKLFIFLKVGCDVPLQA